MWKQEISNNKSISFDSVPNKVFRFLFIFHSSSNQSLHYPKCHDTILRMIKKNKSRWIWIWYFLFGLAAWKSIFNLWLVSTTSSVSKVNLRRLEPLALHWSSYNRATSLSPLRITPLLIYAFLAFFLPQSISRPLFGWTSAHNRVRYVQFVTMSKVDRRLL